MSKEKVESWINAAKEELEYTLKCKKSQDVKEHYIKNAIRYLETAKEELYK